MATVVFALFATVAFVAILIGGGALGSFMEVRKFHAATVTPIGGLIKGSVVTIRAQVAEARRPPPFPRMHPGAAVFTELLVIEQVGRETNTALKAKCAQLFSARDEQGTAIDVDPRGVSLSDAHSDAQKLANVTPEFRNYVNGNGSWRWQSTPATCHEDAIVVGDAVTIQGQVILPMPGEMREGDTELRLIAKKMSLHQASPWKGRSGRTVLISAAVFGVAGLASAASAVWAGWL
ncbi:MAG: hypothetical protein AAF721_40105 [Myxococcota bacterium]